ncbi:MAG: hypothetical protein ABIK93_03275 [candidate division WOR-3 bacterium]
MSNYFLYSVILILYLLILFLIGLFSARRAKSEDEYYLGGRKIGSWVTGLSYVAAYYSSVVIIGGGGYGYKYGLATIWIAAINVLLGVVLVFVVLGKRLYQFTHKTGIMTIPDFFQVRYRSEPAKIFSAVVIALFMIVYNISILKGMANMLEVLLNTTYFIGLLISGLVIIVYVVLGGYLAVVWTGFFQAILMIFALGAVFFATLNRIGGIQAIFDRLYAINPNYVETPGIWGFSGLFTFALVVSLGVWGMPQLLVRFYSVKSKKVLKIAGVLGALGASVAVVPYFCGAASRILFPNLTNADLALPNLVKDIFPPLLIAVFIAGVLAAGMSTFSAVLLLITSAIVKDIFNWQKGIWLSRIVGLTIGIISVLLALKPPGMVLTLTGFAWAVIASTTTIPLIFGLYSKKEKGKAVIVSMVAGFATALIWLILKNPFGIHGFIPGLLTSLIVFIIAQ